MHAAMPPRDVSLGAAAAAAAYFHHETGALVASLPGFLVDRAFACVGPDTGFDATGFGNRQARWLILAIRGSDEPIDLLACTSLATCQYQPNRERLIAYASDPAWRRVSLVGHSLGGAICQYLAYDLVRTDPGIGKRLELWTFNGVGGLIGLGRLHGNVSKQVCRSIKAVHFAHPGDIIPRIGGNIAGELRIIAPGTRSHPDPHNLSHFLRAERPLVSGCRALRDQPFGISGSAERFGPGLRAAVQDWLAGDRVKAALRVLSMLPSVPRGERVEVVRLLLAVAVSLFHARRAIRAIRRGVSGGEKVCH